MKSIARLTVVAILLIPIVGLSQSADPPSTSSTPSTTSSQSTTTSQTSAASQSTGASTEGEGRPIAGYQVQQSVEVGYRFTDVNGDRPMYGTLINQNQGPRLFEQTLSMRAPNNEGTIFDSLYINSFGWGGDPQNVATARVSKFRYYDLNLSFRRDQNFFDYNLLANPLNPATSNPSVPVTVSPHSTYYIRRMYDVDLTIMPQSKVTFRIGMNHNRSNGPSLFTMRAGTEGQADQNWNVTDNLYRFGVDVKVLKDTTISYDQFFDYGKTDTSYDLSNFGFSNLPNGVPVSLGLPFNTGANQPCSTPIKNGAANPTCSGYFAYTGTQGVRASIPTEQLRVVSHLWSRVSFVGQGTYSHSDVTSPYQEFFDGLNSRNGTRQTTFSGPSTVRRINPAVDLGVTIDLTKTLRINESFRFDNWNAPASFNALNTSTAGVPVNGSVTLLSPLGATTTSFTLNDTLNALRTFYNHIQLEYSPDKAFGVRVGYKSYRRRLFHSEPQVIDPLDPESVLTPFEGDTIHTNEYGATFGAWLRPIDKLRINIEAEAMGVPGCQTCSGADEIFITRISPRQRQNYRGRASYKPIKWADISGSLNFWEAKNGLRDTQFSQHLRNVGFAVSLFPKEHVAIDLAYNYTNALQSALICYNTSTNALAPGTIANGCPSFDPANTSDNNNPNSIRASYVSRVHFVNALVMLRPMRRLTTRFGYGLTKNDGENALLNPLQPAGPLQFTYHQPLAVVSLEVIKDWSLNAYWNYDQYAEGSFTGPTIPRYFHDNRAALSVRYAF